MYKLEQGTIQASSLFQPVYGFCLNKNPGKCTFAEFQFLMWKGERAQHTHPAFWDQGPIIFLCVTKSVAPEHGFVHHLFYPLTAVHTSSAALLHLLLLQSLHCLVILLITHVMAFMDLSGKEEVFCLFALSTSPKRSANKDFLLPTSCSFILPGSAARMPTQAWQGL